MRTWLHGWLGVLLLMLAAPDAMAQQSAVLLGTGVTFSGPDVSARDIHGMGGLIYRFPGLLGIRADGMYTNVAQSHLGAVSADLVLHTSPDPQALLQSYILAGGSWFFPPGDDQVGVNVGLGLSVRASPAVGFFIEGRYFRIVNYQSLRDDLILATAGFRIAVSGKR